MKPAKLLLAASVIAGAFANPASADDPRELTDLTSWVWYYGQTSSQINTIRGNGYRLVDLEVDSASPLRFAAAFVKNSGKYAASGTSWWYGTASFIKSKVSSLNARIISLEPFISGGNVYFAAAMVHNSGSQYKNWAWYYGDANGASMASRIAANSGRLIDMDSYKVGSTLYYSYVMIRNTGADQRAWWYYGNRTMSQTLSSLSTNKARFYNLSRNANGRYDSIMLKGTGEHAWYYYGQTPASLTAHWKQNGARIFDLDSYVVGSTRYFTALMLNNSNALTTNVGQILRSGTDGKTGAYLRRIGGSQLAGLQEDEAFEPASSIKIMHHTAAMRQVRLGNAKLTDPILVYTATSGSCPVDANGVYESLQTVLSKMMKNSDNNRTEAIRKKFGTSYINAVGTAVGMTKSKVIHRIGCGSQAIANPNRLTLVDSGKLFESVRNGYLGSSKDDFYSLMLNTTNNFPNWGSTRMTQIISQEASKLGISSSVANLFKSMVEVATKAGNYDFNLGGGNWDYYLSQTGWFKLPCRSSFGVYYREYVGGVFGEKASNKTKLGNAVGAAAVELIRGEIHSALATWKGYVGGTFTAFGSGCKGSNGQVASQSASGLPETGQKVEYKLVNAPKSTFTFLTVGGSKTNWGPFNLPLSLITLGAPGCYLRTDPAIQIAGGTNTSGQQTVALNIPYNQALVGAHLYSQFWIVDLKANDLGLTFTRGIDTMIGGKK